MIDPFTVIMAAGMLLGVLAALGIGLTGAKSHLAALDAQADRQRRIDEHEAALADYWERRRVTTEAAARAASPDSESTPLDRSSVE